MNHIPTGNCKGTSSSTSGKMSCVSLFKNSELGTSSDCPYGAVVCSRDTAYAPTHWIRVIACPSMR
jgi:hypothetical protein